MTESYPTLADGLREAVAWLDRHDGMWPAAAFAVIGVADPGKPSEAKDTLAVHVQALTETEARTIKTTLTSPLAIEGVTEIRSLRRVLEAWAAGEPGELEGWRLPPPRINGTNWEGEAVVSEHYPLIRQLPPADSTYREARFGGFGDQIDVELHNWLTRQAQELTPGHFHPQLFSREYLGGSNWSFGSYYLLLHFPVAVALSATYEAASRLLEATVRFRPPIRIEDLEVRVGNRIFDASLPLLDLTPQEPTPDGWLTARAATEWGPGEPAKVWLTRPGSGLSFGWEASVDTGRADSLDVRQERFLEDWYKLSVRDLATDVDVRAAGMGKGDSPAAMFETALANSLTAVGFSVFTAGGPMKTRGIDLMAFDRRSQRAYAISATISNDLDKKLTSWANTEAGIKAALEPVWTVRPVIISSQPWSSFVEEHLRACHARKVLVLASEHLQPLREAIPDSRTFAQFVAEDPPRPDAFDARWFRRYGRV